MWSESHVGRRLTLNPSEHMKPPRQNSSEVVMSAQRDWKKDMAKAAFVALPMLAPLVAGAKIDYEGTCVRGCGRTINLWAGLGRSTRWRDPRKHPTWIRAISYLPNACLHSLSTQPRRRLPRRLGQDRREQRQRARVRPLPRHVPQRRRQDRLPRPLQERGRPLQHPWPLRCVPVCLPACATV